MLPLPSLFVLLAILRLSHQETYSCNPSASCGCSIGPVILKKIVGGENARIRTWGWIVSIRNKGKHSCGGSILSETWVMTAAHCIFGFKVSELAVFAGSIHVNVGAQKSKVAAVISHPNYDVDSYLNDIALIQLSSPFDMTKGALAKICLPGFTTDQHPPVGSHVVAIGWGKATMSDASSPQHLQQVTLKTIPYYSAACSSWIPWSSDTSTQFCAGADEGGKDTCGGDSGGPVMIFTPNKQWVVVGLTSYGIEKCGSPGHAGVYTRVVPYLEWITSIIYAIDDSSPPEYETAGDYDSKQTSSICSRHYSPSLFCIITWTMLSLCFV